MAPEMVARQGYGRAADYWSLGCIAYEMLSGLPPFQTKQGAKELFRKIMSERVKMPPGSTAAACKLLKGLLNRDVQKRWGTAKSTMFQVGGVAGLKQAEFFKKIDWEKLERKEVDPPKVLSVHGEEDLKHFHDEFTTMTLPRSVVEMSKESFRPHRVKSETFKGFSFIQEDFNLPEREDEEMNSYWRAVQEDGESVSECASSKLDGDDAAPVVPEKKKRPPRKRKKKKNAAGVATTPAQSAATTPVPSTAPTPAASEDGDAVPLMAVALKEDKTTPAEPGRVDACVPKEKKKPERVNSSPQPTAPTKANSSPQPTAPTPTPKPTPAPQPKPVKDAWQNVPSTKKKPAEDSKGIPQQQNQWNSPQPKNSRYQQPRNGGALPGTSTWGQQRTIGQQPPPGNAGWNVSRKQPVEQLKPAPVANAAAAGPSTGRRQHGVRTTATSAGQRQPQRSQWGGNSPSAAACESDAVPSTDWRQHAMSPRSTKSLRQIHQLQPQQGQQQPSWPTLSLADDPPLAKISATSAATSAPKQQNSQTKGPSLQGAWAARTKR